MENRDRDKVNKNTSSSIGNQKSESDVSFGKNIGRSESLNDESSRRSGSVGSSGMRGDSKNSRGNGSVGSDMESSPSSESSRLDDESRRH
jgi:hypothetical protein